MISCDTFTGTYIDGYGGVRRATVMDCDRTQQYKDANGVRRTLNILEGVDQYGDSFRMYRYDVGDTWYYPSVVMVYRSATGATRTEAFGPRSIIPERIQVLNEYYNYYYPYIIFQH